MATVFVEHASSCHAQGSHALLFSSLPQSSTPFKLNVRCSRKKYFISLLCFVIGRFEGLSTNLSWARVSRVVEGSEVSDSAWRNVLQPIPLGQHSAHQGNGGLGGSTLQG